MGERIAEKGDAVISLALDTIARNKQALIFVNSKRSAEKVAEDISKKTKTSSEKLNGLSEKLLKVLSKPTKQCTRLAGCVRKGVAFHHAGLHSEQKRLVEDGFRDGSIKIICCTPTLCIAGDTKIWHGFSETEVSKFKTNNSIFVLSRDKLISIKPQRIEKIWNSSKLVQISSVSGHSIKVTPNHKVLVKRKDRKMVLRASGIKRGDKIATIGRLNFTKVTVPSIRDFVVEHKADVINYKFDPKTSYFIGIMLGDGYSGAETSDGRIKFKGSPSIVGRDEEIFSKASEVCARLGISCRKSVMFHGASKLVLGKNKWFREFLVRSGVEKRDKKHISEKLMGMGLENIAALLRGLFDTDGYVDGRAGPGFSNVSEKLIKQVQKLLLRFGIVSTVRKKKAGSMKIYGNEYKTLPRFELDIRQKKSILDFYRFIGFSVKRKQDALISLIARICSNLNYVSCNNCKYKIYKDVFSGRTKAQKAWGQTKLKVIKLLGENGELGSRELFKLLKSEPKKAEARLNHHYELIKKRRIGNRENTEWFWSLNSIGKWIFENIINKNKKIEGFFELKNCPLCGNQLDWIVKKGWRHSDFEGDIFWDKIREVKEVECTEDVYDVVLPNNPENDHMFVANGFIVHNSYGLDLPAFRSIIRDVHRFGSHGMAEIPVLEFLQFCGRAGRPKFDSSGEAIVIAKSEADKDYLVKRYLLGEPEEITSKLAVEPVLRTYLLSLIASRIVGSEREIVDFFSKTFWAFQYGSLSRLKQTINKILAQLVDWGFLVQVGSRFGSTPVGRRVSELYIDPLTAHEFLEGLAGLKGKVVKHISFLQLVSNTLEMRPALRVKVSEFEELQEKVALYQPYLLQPEQGFFEPEYEDWLSGFKTALMFQEWIDEKDEEYLMEKYSVRPGELHSRLEIADWLLYGLSELARLQRLPLKELYKTRVCLKYGVREELLPLVRLKGIGRVRARKLYNSGIKSLEDVAAAPFLKLSQLLGPAVAKAVKAQLGRKVEVFKEKENI